jgi:hypothetical protein
MATSPTDMAGHDANDAQRARVRRTAWILAACAVGAYALFLVSVMGGQ